LFIGGKKAYPWWRQNTFHQVIRGWDWEEINNHKLIVPYKRQSSMLDLQAADLTINKENLPPTLDPQSKKSTPQLN
jgi:hypothetical protein